MVVLLQTIQKALVIDDFNEQRIREAREMMLPAPALADRRTLPPDGARIGSVLILFYLRQTDCHLVLTRRQSDLRTHAGQISFPGGGREGDETLVATALRETEEEIGVPTTAVNILGKLTPAYIPPSNYVVHPFVGWYKESDELVEGGPIFRRNPGEVAEILEVAVYTLLDEAVRQEEPRHFKDQPINIPYFAVDHYKVWGATAAILSEVVERLRHVMVIDPV
jgi:8-oxo-dGTP pyrophosphatase MutT (NUDIX family)